jgi:hypothetical protein
MQANAKKKRLRASKSNGVNKQEDSEW